MKGAVIKPVADFAEVVTGGTPSTTKPEYWDGDIPWLNSGALNGGVVAQPSRFITQQGLANSSAKLMPKDTVLVALTGATTGQVGYLAIEASANQSVTGILPSREHHPKYLYHFLRSQRKKILGDAFGGAQPHINQKYIKDFKIPLPPLDDQIRIAHLLGRVEGLIAQRKHHLEQLDDLLRSVFLEMFGDPVRNERGWDTGSLSTYGSFKNGLNFVKGESGVTVRYLGIGDFKSKAILDDFDSLAFIELNHLPAADYYLQDGDLLFVRSNGNRELVGRCMAVYPGAEKVTYSGFCIRYRINDSALRATFIAHLFRSSAFRRLLFQGGQGANIQNINQQVLSSLPIPVPTVELQSQFAVIVDKIEAIKYRYRQSLIDLESLYGALSQQAFEGELDLLRVPMPGIEPEEEKAVAAEPLQAQAEQELTIHLPDSDNLLAALVNAEARKNLLAQWLDAYLGLLGSRPFSVQHFMAVAQTRLTLSHPDNNFVLCAEDYDHIRAWVFKALAGNRLEQAFDDADNRIELKVVQA